MGTKNNPAAFDCYDKADPDEPMFILLGRDPRAPGLVDLWADIRELDGGDPAKIAEARQCAAQMRAYKTGTAVMGEVAFSPTAVSSTDPVVTSNAGSSIDSTHARAVESDAAAGSLAGSDTASRLTSEADLAAASSNDPTTAPVVVGSSSDAAPKLSDRSVFGAASTPEGDVE